MTKLTVKDLFNKKGKVKLTELYVTNALEAYAAEQAGIDIQIVSFKKETLRTGVPTNKWFRDAHIKDIREAAPNTFMIYGLGQLSSPEKAIDAALIAREINNCTEPAPSTLPESKISSGIFCIQAVISNIANGMLNAIIGIIIPILVFNNPRSLTIINRGIIAALTGIINPAIINA